MDKENCITLSKYRKEQARENLEEAYLLFRENKYKGASKTEHIIVYFMQ